MKAFLHLEDGTTITGTSFGATGTQCGELVFNTGMTGYQEILTDPSYAGQIVVMTYPLIGNYGINTEDYQSLQVQAKGLVVGQCANRFSHWKGELSLVDYLKQQNVFGLSDIDTRMLTRKIRSQGAMACIFTTECLTPELKSQLLSIHSTQGMVAKTSTPITYQLAGCGLKLGLVDLGVKYGILRQLQRLGCQIQVFPWNTSAEEILSYQLDAVLFSNGPGDPKEIWVAVQTAEGLIGKLPLFGICLGLQVLGLALGADTYQLHFGHRGSNHAVMNLQTQQVTMTAQNHGYALQEDSLPKTIVITHRNVNDNTIEGFIEPHLRVYAVQFHPEAGPGPRDSEGIFELWLESLSQEKCCA